jgi:hypothetical protein
MSSCGMASLCEHNIDELMREAMANMPFGLTGKYIR